MSDSAGAYRYCGQCGWDGETPLSYCPDCGAEWFVAPDGGNVEEYEVDPQRCTECEAIIRVGSVGGSFGAYCDCTPREGRPIHHMNGYPWPSRWAQDRTLDLDQEGENDV